MRSSAPDLEGLGRATLPVGCGGDVGHDRLRLSAGFVADLDGGQGAWIAGLRG